MSKKRTLVAIGAAVLALATVSLVIAGYVYRGEIRLLLMRPIGKPETPPAPDYSRPESWAHWQADDQVGKVDVFFVHATTFTSRSSWNAHFAEAGSKSDSDAYAVFGVSDFNIEGARIYVPRYRQATYYATRRVTDPGLNALTLAYQDIEQAFRLFLTVREPNRPLVIIGKGQGALHAATLLERQFAGEENPLRKKLAVAFLFHWPITASAREDEKLPNCSRQVEFRCLIASDSPPMDWPEFSPIHLIWQSDRYVIASPDTPVLDISAGPNFDARVDALLAALEEEAQILAPIEDAVEIGESPINKVPD